MFQLVLPLILKEKENIRFEDIHNRFMNKFAKYKSFRTTAQDFIEGQMYNAFDLAIYTQTYDNRGGGIRPVGKTGTHEAVVVNVTLSGGKYANEWLDTGTRLKCYLKSRVNKGRMKFEESYEANKSIIEFPDVPILVFSRESARSDFFYNGKFRWTKIENDDDGSKWFELTKIASSK